MSQYEVGQTLSCTGLSLAVVQALKPSRDDAVSAVSVDCREGEGAYEGLISLEISSATAVLSRNGWPVLLGVLSALGNISHLIFYLSD